MASMRNVEMSLKGDILTIKVDLSQEHGPSSSGKSVIVATTSGAQPLPERPEIRLGLNAFKKA